MTKEQQNLVWRLKEAPQADAIAKLVEQKVITTEEAREILFSKSLKNSDEENKALKEQITFLQKTIDSLINKLNNSGYYWRYTDIYKPRFGTTYWYNNDGTTLATYSYDSGTVTLTAGNLPSENTDTN